MDSAVHGHVPELAYPSQLADCAAHPRARRWRCPQASLPAIFMLNSTLFFIIAAVAPCAIACQAAYDAYTVCLFI